MKKAILSFFCALMLIGCADKPVKTILLTNPSDDFREGAMVEVRADALGLTNADFAQLGLFNEEGEQIPYQVMHYGNQEAISIVFEATVRAKMQVAYTLKKTTPLQVPARVFARFVPERKDDFAWENDCAAYRMYGPALAPENPSNGIDLWLKKTSKLIVDTFYYREHELGLPYHVDYGKGLDCYKVGHTAGCGGVFPVVAGLPQIGNQFDRWQIIDKGPLRVVFALVYDNYFGAEEKPVSEIYIVTCDAGQQLCKAEVTFVSEEGAEFTELGAGIFLHTSTSNPAIAVEGNTQIGLNAGYIAYAENAVSDAGLASGRNYSAVVMPGMKEHAILDAMLYGKVDYEMGSTYIYYFGGGWSEWLYPTDNDWFEATAYSARLVSEPIEWKIAE